MRNTHILQRMIEGVDRPVADPLDGGMDAVAENHAAETDLRGLVGQLLQLTMSHKLILFRYVDVVFLKYLKQFPGGQFPSGPVAFRFDESAELGVHGLGQRVTEGVLHDKGGSALARLGIDTDDGLILAADVGRVDRQVRYFPIFGARFLHILNALIDGVLMRA
ncbi:hypothetical protein SDC9_199295 [bioreactor metagenome]|uniref:Uncharacterized protein n=1 Tax=bioreactor metagenome TaxID=1076179 RepID=A0A645IKU6_9ZZZZ